MSELPAQPPPEDLRAAIAQISRLGPDGKLGPEDAGAVLILQATFTTPEGAAAFWRALVPLLRLLEDTPGFIRRFGVSDGPANTLIALWRTPADAYAFAAGPEHRSAVKALYAERWEYTHFAAVWELASTSGRVIFCPDCDAVAPASNDHCPDCGRAMPATYRAD